MREVVEEEEEEEEEEDGGESDATEPAEEEEESEESEDEGVDPKQFFEEVEKLTGSELDVDYGDVDPLTPEGIALREKAVREDTLSRFMEEIEQKYPAAYRALSYAFDGGDPSELFKATTTRDYSKVELGEKDSPLAKEILKEYYASKGMKNQSKIDKLIELAEDSDEGLIGEANNALKELQEEQEAKQKELLEEQQKQAEQQRQRDRNLIKTVDSLIDSGKIGTFKLNGLKEQSEFKRFVRENIRRTADGNYEFSTQIEPSNLEKLIQYQYFQYKGGNVDKLVQIKAATENAKKLKLRLQGEKSKAKGSGSESGVRGDKLSFKDFEVD